jgi:hypothetical protein
MDDMLIAGAALRPRVSVAAWPARGGGADLPQRGAVRRRRLRRRRCRRRRAAAAAAAAVAGEVRGRLAGGGGVGGGAAVWERWGRRGRGGPPCAVDVVLWRGAARPLKLEVLRRAHLLHNVLASEGLG